VTAGVNVRSGPGTTFSVIGTVETGFEVLVVCAANGESVTGTAGPTNQWLRIDFTGKVGYVSAAYVAMGSAINDPKQVARCPG
jgi:uncharacterized protein YraI